MQKQCAIEIAKATTMARARSSRLTCNEAHRLTTDQQCLLMSTYMSRSTPAYHNTCFYQDFTPSDTPHQLSGSPQQVIRLLLLILAVAKRGRFPLLSAAERWPRSRRTLAPLTQNGEMADCPNRVELEEGNAPTISELDITKVLWTQGSGA